MDYFILSIFFLIFFVVSYRIHYRYIKCYLCITNEYKNLECCFIVTIFSSLKSSTFSFVLVYLSSIKLNETVKFCLD